MRQKIIAVNLNGTIIRSSPLINAKQKLFDLMGTILEDSSATAFAQSKNTLQSVYDLIETHTGLDSKYEGNKEVITNFANSMITMNYLSEISRLGKNYLLIPEFADWLRAKRTEGYSVVLVTCAPESVIQHVLKLIECQDVFDEIQSTPKYCSNTTKNALETITQNGEVVCYIGKTLYDVYAARSCRIPSIVPTWDLDGSIAYKEAESQADHLISSPEELDSIFSQLVGSCKNNKTSLLSRTIKAAKQKLSI